MSQMLKGEYIDLNFLNQISEGDNVFFLDMIDTFLKDAPGVIVKMEASLAGGKWKELGDLAHGFKTSLTFMGLKDLSDRVREVEFSCRSGQDIHKLPGLFGDIKTTFQNAITELTKFRASFQE